VCLELATQYPRIMFFAFQVERRLQWKGLPMTVIPLRVREPRARAA
jgi:hypothetical protein